MKDPKELPSYLKPSNFDYIICSIIAPASLFAGWVALLFMLISGCGTNRQKYIDACKRVDESCAELGHGICPHCNVEHTTEIEK